MRQAYVAEFALHDYPITEADIVSRGELAWNSSLNTINVGKFELGCASIGIATHCLYEALNHAAGRSLYGRYVTDFPHVKKLFTEGYVRLLAMKLFALRAADYMRAASDDDRRYLLFNPIVKMKVTGQGEKVVGCCTRSSPPRATSRTPTSRWPCAISACCRNSRAPSMSTWR